MLVHIHMLFLHAVHMVNEPPTICRSFLLMKMTAISHCNFRPLVEWRILGYFFHPKVTLTRNLASHRKTGRIQRVGGLLACSVNLGLHYYKGEITLDLL
jgi:hypothetical protein